MESEKPEEEEEQEAPKDTKPQEKKKKTVQGSLDRNLETGLLDGDEDNE